MFPLEGLPSMTSVLLSLSFFNQRLGLLGCSAGLKFKTQMFLILIYVRVLPTMMFNIRKSRFNEIFEGTPFSCPPTIEEPATRLQLFQNPP